MAFNKLLFLITILFANTLFAQTDSVATPQIKNSSLNKTTNATPKFKKTVFSFALGVKGMQRPLDSRLYGTDRQFITYVDWIPMSLKGESFVDKNFSIGVSINVINYQRIYDAIWTNSSTQKVGVHRFTDIRTRMSILFRSDVYFIRRKMVEAYIGGGAGFAFNKRKYEVRPDGYEFGGSGQSEPIIRFLSHFGLECSMGFRFYPLKEGKLGVLVEGGLMQSYGRFGLSYRF